jgi:hypothetical protein
MVRTIKKVIVLKNYQLAIIYTDDSNVVVDFKPTIQQGGVFVALADPDFFAQVTLDARGRFIEWPGELDFCADALWLEGQPAGASILEPALVQEF